MSEPNLRELIETAATAIRQVWDKTHHILPMYHFIQSDGQEGLMPVGNLPSKEAAVEVAKLVFERQGVIAYVFVCECWALMGKISDEDVAKAKTGTIANHPDRKEQIGFIAEGQNGLLSAWINIDRTHEPPTLGKLEVMDEEVTSSEGLMVGLLPRKGTVQ